MGTCTARSARNICMNMQWDTNSSCCVSGQLNAIAILVKYILQLLLKGEPFVETRNVLDDDYYKVIEVLNDWWGGRQMKHLLPRLFFEHFQPTSFIVENEGELSAFLIGFVSQTRPNEAYIHFVGVKPELRKSGLARQLYQRFFTTIHGMGCNTVHCITSPVNEGSISFHKRMGFSVFVGTDYAGSGQDRILFSKKIESEVAS